MKNKYLEVYEKFKDYQLPEIGVIFDHPTESRPPEQGHQVTRRPIQYKVVSYCDSEGLVETVHSGWQTLRSLHWIRKHYNTPIK